MHRFGSDNQREFCVLYSSQRPGQCVQVPRPVEDDEPQVGRRSNRRSHPACRRGVEDAGVRHLAGLPTSCVAPPRSTALTTNGPGLSIRLGSRGHSLAAGILAHLKCCGWKRNKSKRKWENRGDSARYLPLPFLFFCGRNGENRNSGRSGIIDRRIVIWVISHLRFHSENTIKFGLQMIEFHSCRL